ncbi:MAG TPA: hypothetical protein VEU08_22925 [Vicinamibacterales bacterium]|nr:hypothetical protein [Vicinamibacterales bacterium]
MKTTHRRRQEAHERVYAVCLKFRDAISSNPAGEKTIVKLDKSVTDVGTRLTDQQGFLADRLAATAACEAGRLGIRDNLQAVAKISAFVTLPEGSAKVNLLPTDVSDKQLTSQAEAVLERVKPNAAAFIAEGLPSNVLTDLEQQIADLKKAKQAQATARRQYAAATNAIKADLIPGDEAIQVIDTILKKTSPALDGDALTELRNAKRVGPARATAKAPAQPEPVPAPPAPTETPTKVA